MRAIHFCFQLHEPYKMREFSNGEYFDSEAEFRERDQRIYQSFFALLERNTQRYKQLHFSLMISGAWLELAEKYDVELVRRLRKLVELKQIEIIVEPYYHSLALFYNEKEFLEQIELMERKLSDALRAEGRILALPEMVYADGIAQWAEGLGFVGMLAGGLSGILRWHSPNHVYEAAGCEYLRVLFNNQHLTAAILERDERILGEEKLDEDGEAKMRAVLSAEKFQRLVELDVLRGNLVNLYFNVEELWNLADVGIVGFLDKLVAGWLKKPGNRFLHAGEAVMFEEPEGEILVAEAAGWKEKYFRGSGKKTEIPEILQKSEEQDAREEGEKSSSLPVLYEHGAMTIPGWLDFGARKKANEQLYAVRREIFASEDEKLITDFRKLTGVDYVLEMDARGLRNWERILGDLRRRANEAKKSQAVEISRAYTKRRDRGEAESVRVNFEKTGVGSVKKSSDGDGAELLKVEFGGRRSAGVAGASVHAAQNVVETIDDEPMVIVRRLPNLAKHDPEATEPAEVRSGMEQARGETSEKTAQAAKTKAGKGLRRVIRKLVIE